SGVRPHRHSTGHQPRHGADGARQRHGAAGHRAQQRVGGRCAAGSGDGRLGRRAVHPRRPGAPAHCRRRWRAGAARRACREEPPGARQHLQPAAGPGADGRLAQGVLWSERERAWELLGGRDRDRRRGAELVRRARHQLEYPAGGPDTGPGPGSEGDAREPDRPGAGAAAPGSGRRRAGASRRAGRQGDHRRRRRGAAECTQPADAGRETLRARSRKRRRARRRSGGLHERGGAGRASEVQSGGGACPAADRPGGSMIATTARPSRWALGFTLAGVCIAAAGCGKGPGGGADRAIPVLVSEAVTRDVPIFLEGLGTVTAYKTVNVRSQVDGRLDKVVFREGQAVKQNEVLAQIDPRPFKIMLEQGQAALTRDQAQLDGAKRDLDRYEAVGGQHLLPQQQIDDQRALVAQLTGTVQNDHATIDNAKLQLDYARIKSPINGVTGVRLVDPGNLVHAADAGGIVVVTQMDPIAVLFTLPQDDLPDVAKQQAAGPLVVEARSRDGAQLLANGQLELIDNQINQGTATMRLKAIFPNPERALWPNQFV